MKRFLEASQLMQKHFRPGTFFCHLILIHLTQPHQIQPFQSGCENWYCIVYWKTATWEIEKEMGG